jgi:hypothetical protein
MAQLFYALKWPPTLQFFEDLYPKIRLFQASSVKNIFSNKSSTKCHNATQRSETPGETLQNNLALNTAILHQLNGRS